MSWSEWAPYVSVAERRRRAKKKMDSLRKRGVDIQPIEIEGRKIAKTFWGQAWCDHLEGFSDFENRLPRGRTYVRNGSVCHLAIAQGKVEAKVSGSTIYNLRIQIKTLPSKKWNAVKRRCAGQIGSLIELLAGNLSDQVMEVVTDRREGLFPLRGEISFDCSCPDWAVMCKHVAAVLYGVGARLDTDPALLFTLRGVNHQELIDTDAEAALGAATRRGKSKQLAADALADVFGIEIDAGHAVDSAPDSADPPPATPRKKAGKRTRPAASKPAREENGKKAATKKSPKKKASTKKTPQKKSSKKTTPTKKTPQKKSSKKTTPTKKSPRRPAKKSAVGKKSAKTSGASKEPPASVVNDTTKRTKRPAGGKRSATKTPASQAE